MKHLLTLTLMCLAMGLNAQLNYPWNPDEDGDSSIGSNDLLGFLTVYGEDFEPEPITVDSVDLLSVISSLQNQLEELQSQVDSLSVVTSTVQGVSVLQGEDTIASNTQSLRFVGNGMNVTTGEALNEAVVNIPGGTTGGGGTKVYAFKIDYGGASASGVGSRGNDDVANVTQVTSSPFATGSTTTTIPTSAGDNKVRFKFNDETSPFVNFYIIGYNAVTESYRWTHIDSPQRTLWDDITPISIMDGLTQSTGTTANSGYVSTDTNILTSFSSASWQIDLNNDETGIANSSDGFTVVFAHAYIFFIFPS